MTQESIALWLIAIIPLGFYLSAIYFAYEVSKIRQGFPAWIWSWRVLCVVLIGRILDRLSILMDLWGTPPEEYVHLVNPEGILIAWAVSIGLWLHVWLVWRWCKRQN